MKLNRFLDAKEFYCRTEKYLLEKEFINSLMLRLAKRLADNPQTYSENTPYLATVEKDNNIVAVALRTLKRNLILSDVKDLKALEKIARYIYKNYPEIPGVTGLTKETKTFAKIWHNLTGQSYKISMHLRIHKLEKVQAINKAKGNLSLVDRSNRDSFISLTKAFYQEAAGSIPANIDKDVDRHLNEQRFYFWEDNNKIVAIANAVPVTSNCVNIGLVYTPMLLRWSPI